MLTDEQAMAALELHDRAALALEDLALSMEKRDPLLDTVSSLANVLRTRPVGRLARSVNREENS